VASRLHDWFLETWYGAGRRGRWLLPAAWLFGVAVRIRRALYCRGWLRRYRSRRPVVVVGNLTVGGTGKTPFVIWLAQELGSRGLRVGIAMRGYGGGGGPARLLSGGDTAETSGDEPCLVRRRLRRPVAIGPRRPDAVRVLEPDCDVIVCDDGLQHYALARDVEVAVVDGDRGFGNGRLLPAGPMREPAARLATVDAVVVNGEGFDRPEAIRMRLEPTSLVALADGTRRPLAEFASRRVLAVAAIGNPRRFFELLRRQGLDVIERALPDHAVPDPAIVRSAPGIPVLMTEKDAVKCAGGAWPDAWYLEVEARVEGAAALVERIASLAAARRED
jgi:tetraacyldisaccharide 4'-kinase